MDETPPRMKRARKAKPPPKDLPWVVLLTHRKRFGAPVYLAPSPDLAPSKSRAITSKLRYAARFATEKEAARFARFFRHPDYINTPAVLQEDIKAKPKAPGPRQIPLFPEE